MKRVLLGFVALAAVLASEGRATAAPVEFYVEADSSAGALTGTITIDTATGTVLGADLGVYQGRSEVAVFDGHVYVEKYSNRVEIMLNGYWVASKEKESASISINVEAKSLVGYGGGPINGNFVVYVGGESGASTDYFIGELTR
jgi:hypothetical protein